MESGLNPEPVATGASRLEEPTGLTGGSRSPRRGRLRWGLALALVFAAGVVAVGLRSQPASSAAPADALAALAASAGGHTASASRDDASLRAFPARPERPTAPFSLIDHTGGAWHLDEQRGRVVLVFFGYTQCPDVCPQTLDRLRSALEDLGPAATGVRVALVSVDPAHDTPPVLAGYLAGFGPSFTGLTGRPDELHAVTSAFGVPFEAAAPEADHADHAGDQANHADVEDGAVDHILASAVDAGGDAHGSSNAQGHDAGQAPAAAAAPEGVLHSSRVFLVDAFGQLRGTYVGVFAPSDVAHDLRLLLAERDRQSN